MLRCMIRALDAGARDAQYLVATLRCSKHSDAYLRRAADAPKTRRSSAILREYGFHESFPVYSGA